MGLTITGYFTIDQLAIQLEFATKEHLGSNPSAYGFNETGGELQPDASTYFWGPEDLQSNMSFFLDAPETKDLIRILRRKGLIDEYFATPKMAVTVTGSIRGRNIMQTNAVDIARAAEISNGLGIPGFQKSFLVWNYISPNQYARAVEELWLPDRDQKLQTLEQQFARPMPPPPQ